MIISFTFDKKFAINKKYSCTQKVCKKKIIITFIKLSKKWDFKMFFVSVHTTKHIHKQMNMLLTNLYHLICVSFHLVCWEPLWFYALKYMFAKLPPQWSHKLTSNYSVKCPQKYFKLYTASPSEICSIRFSIFILLCWASFHPIGASSVKDDVADQPTWQSKISLKPCRINY